MLHIFSKVYHTLLKNPKVILHYQTTLAQCQKQGVQNISCQLGYLKQ
jgi:hypothetical protein